jgi:diguanylate cyclase (GGDEF)-like protein
MQTQILGLVTPLMALFFAATFAMLWRVGRMKRYVLGFAVAYVFFPLGFLVTHFLPPEAIYTFHTTHLFYTVATVSLMASICERAGQRLHLASMAVIYLLTALALAFAIGLSNDAGPRVIIVNIGYGAMTLMAFTFMLQSRPRETVDIVILSLMALGAADFLIRPVITLLFERSIPAEVYRDSVYYSLIGLALGLKAVTTALTLIIATIGDLTTAMRESSQRDPLTGLHNRAAFEEAMRGKLSKAQNQGCALSLIVADIDNFKQVNDIWGHQSGDEAISGFGRLIEGMVRGCDTAGRIGGEEFCIAVWNCPNEPATRLAERIRVAFARLEHAGIGSDIRLTASFGVATARAGENYRELFARADAALYLAKSGGRNQVRNAELPATDPAIDLADGNAAAASPQLAVGAN